MTRTELLSMAERLDAHAEVHEKHFPQDEEQREWAADLRAQAAYNRKLAELRPVARGTMREEFEAWCKHDGWSPSDLADKFHEDDPRAGE